MKRRMSGVFSMTVAAPAILAGLIALGLVARPAMAAGGATPITASTVITAPGQYVVTASFTGGIEITVSDVHLDLGGQTITDVTSFDAIKVYPGANDVVITNGTVATSNPGGTGSSNTGVEIFGENCRVSGLTVTGFAAAFGIFLEGGGGVVSGCNCSGNAGGIGVFSQFNTVKGNNCSFNGVGINVFAVASNTIVGNTAQNNGVDAFDQNGNCVSNTWHGNTFGGVNPTCIH